MIFKPLMAGAMVLGLATVPFTHAAGGQSADMRSSHQIGNDVGVLVAGTTVDEKQVKKQRNPYRDQHPDHNAQVTIGGAKSLISGQIGAIRGNYYFVKDEGSGDETRLLVNQDTNLDCSAAPEGTKNVTHNDVVADRQSSDVLASGASERQKEQGQKEDETAVGSGFRIGTCAFKPGDRIKAEVDDMGRVTMLRLLADRGNSASPQSRSIGESAGTGELAIPGRQDKPGQLDMTGPQGYPPKQYSILPVPVGELKPADHNGFLQSPVRDPDGTIIGSLHRLMIDSNTGQIEYAVVLLRDSDRMEVVPWTHMKITQSDKGSHALVVNTKQYQLSPDVTRKDITDRSPAMKEVTKHMESAEAPADLRHRDLPIPGTQTTNQRRSSSEAPVMCTDGSCKVLRGRVVKFEGNALVIKDTTGKEVRTVVDTKTHKGQVGMRDEPQVGDWIEAYVSPKGHAESISLLRGGSGISNEGDG